MSLPPAEAEHLSRVLRLRSGASIVAFDGKGQEFLACVDAIDHEGVSIRIVERRQPAPEPPVALTLGQALLKSDKMDQVIRDAAMLGVSTIQPLLSARIDVPAAAARSAARKTRWERTAVASVKQCGRAVVPAIRDVAPLGDIMRASETPMVMLVEPGGAVGTPAEPVEVLERHPRPLTATILVGPEGGWASEELAEAAACGVQLLTLGPRTLRADAAAAAALAILLYIWRD